MCTLVRCKVVTGAEKSILKMKNEKNSLLLQFCKILRYFYCSRLSLISSSKIEREKRTQNLMKKYNLKKTKKYNVFQTITKKVTLKMISWFLLLLLIKRITIKPLSLMYRKIKTFSKSNKCCCWKGNFQQMYFGHATMASLHARDKRL